MISQEALCAALLPEPMAYEENASFVRAAVLFPLILREEGFAAILTQRTAHLKAHAGQISFPGGRIEPKDASPKAAALREAAEEIGLFPHQAEVLGYLPDYFIRASGFHITPALALISSDFEPIRNAHEVAEVFEVPLSFLMNPAHHERHFHETKTGSRTYWAISYQNRFIWGATAAVIVSLFERLSENAP